MSLRDYTDIHTHNPAAGPAAIINLPWGAEVPPAGSYSVGIHPWDTAAVTAADLEALERVASAANVVAIGETGIDALRGAPPERQEEIFLRHVAASESLGKPLIIHAVRSLPRIMQLRKLLRPKQQWVIHGYRGNATTARQLIRLGIDISLGSKYNKEVEDQIPPEHIYRETDMD